MDQRIWGGVVEHGSHRHGTIAVIALRQTAQDSRDRSRPVVIAEFRPARDSTSAIDLVVRNLGASVARDLEVSFEPQLVVPDTGGPFVTPFLIKRYADPIPAVAPGQDLRNIWWSGAVGHGNDLENSEPTPDEVRVNVQYRGSGKSQYCDSFSLHVDIVKMTTYSTSSDSLPGRLKTMDASLKQIAGATQQLSRFFRREREKSSSSAVNISSVAETTAADEPQLQRLRRVLGRLNR